MQTKDINSKSNFTEIQTDRLETESHLEDLNKVKQPVDINVLKSRLRENYRLSVNFKRIISKQ